MTTRMRRMTGRWTVQALCLLSMLSGCDSTPEGAEPGSGRDVAGPDRDRPDTSEEAEAGVEVEPDVADAELGDTEAVDAVSVDGSGCVGEECASDAAADTSECSDGQPSECVDGTLSRRCGEGRWIYTLCDAETVCTAGVCAPLTCEPGEEACLDAQSLGRCRDDGTAWEVTTCNAEQTCDAETLTCECQNPTQILFLLDASGSMALNEIGGLTRWQLARAAIADVMAEFPDISYGLKTFPDAPVVCDAPGCSSTGGCAASFADGFDFAPGATSTEINDFLLTRGLSAGSGRLDLVLTPLVNAFESLTTLDIGRFRTEVDQPRYVVLISDGEDTCLAPHAPEIVPGTLGRAVTELRTDWNIQTYPIGFGYAEGSRQLAAIAQAGGTGLAEPLLATDGEELRERIFDITSRLDEKRCEVLEDPSVPPNCVGAGLTDADADGWCSDLDCDDANASVWPGAVEVVAGVDDDCDGDVDEAEGYIPPVPESIGCRGIDFLFVIDNSGSMSDEQAALASSVPGFLAAIERSAPTGDFHIMVVDSDESGLTGGGSSSGCSSVNGVRSCTCSPAPSCCDAICADPAWGPTTTCNGAPACDTPEPPPLSACDQTLGAGRVYSGTYDSCFSGAFRWVGSGVSGLAATFACMARVGAAGDGNERVMQAMGNAVNPPLSALGGCNEGFLRNDAILVVTYITDEPEGGSAGTPDTWRTRLLAAKGGRADAIYTLGIFSDRDQPVPVCSGGDAAPLLRTFLDSWGEQGHFCSVCLTSYSDCLAAAVDGIATTCENYVTE